MMIAVNGKVLRWVGDLSDPSARMMYEYTASRYAGTDVTFKWSRMLYEPKYRIATCYSDMQDDHKAWVEDMFANRFTGNQQPNYVCVGLLSDITAQNGATPRAKTTQQTVHTLDGDMTVTQKSVNKL